MADFEALAGANCRCFANSTPPSTDPWMPPGTLPPQLTATMEDIAALDQAIAVVRATLDDPDTNDQRFASALYALPKLIEARQRFTDPEYLVRLLVARYTSPEALAQDIRRIMNE